MNTAYRAIQLIGTGTPTLDCDYQLIWGGGTNIVISPTTTHDTHSIFADPLFIVASPSVAADFRLQPTSPARGAGTPWSDWTLDYLGNPTLNPPSIGAFDSNGRWIIAPTVRATLLRIGTP